MSGPPFTGTVHWSHQDLEHTRRMIAQGLLPPDAIERHFEDEAKSVFGENYQRDKAGNPIEQGKGSKAQPTLQSVEAYRRYGKAEPNYEETLRLMEESLAAFTAAQAKRRGRASRVSP